MKKTVFFFALLTSLFIACQRETSSPPSQDVTIQASKSTAAKNESVSISIQNMPAGNNYTRWSVSPATGAVVSNVYTGNGQGTTVTFNQAGLYEVSADLRTVHPNCMPSPGVDTCYSNRASIAIAIARITVSN